MSHANSPAPHGFDQDFYTIHDLEKLVEERPQLYLGTAAASSIKRGSDFLADKLQEDLHIYGANSGLGALCEIRVPDSDIHDLQRRLLLSHACGVGDIVSEEVSRMMLLIKILTFRSGHTAITQSTVQRLIDLWNAGAIPAVPKRGTVGASGDLSPLAHLALPLIGEGQVWFKGQLHDSSKVLTELGWEPLRLQPKEGLALVNGVQYINSMAVRTLSKLSKLARYADLVASLSVQGFSVSRSFCLKLYHETSLHPERSVVATNLRELLEGSNHDALPTSNKSQQDPYSFRCIPQVHAAVRQTLDFATTVIEREVNSVSDNPLFFPDHDQILYGGNLHGASTAMVLDYLAIAATELGSMSERRSYQLLSGQRGLSDFLVKEPGLNSGFMVAQYTSAALVNENKVLSNPASVDTIPTSQLQEDSVSMGGTSGYKLERILENCHTILSIELLLAMQAIDLNRDLVPSPLAEAMRAQFRDDVPFLKEDRLLSVDIERSVQFLATYGPRFIDGLQ